MKKFETKVLLYEDLKYDKSYFYKEISTAFEISLNDTKELLDNKHKNIKKKGSIGTLRLISLKRIEQYFRRRLKKNSKLFNGIKKLYNYDIFKIKKIINYRFHLPFKVHKQTSNNKIKNSLKLKNTFPVEKYNLNIDKLKKYEYI